MLSLRRHPKPRPPYRSPTLRLVRYLWWRKLTRQGRFVFLGLVVACLMSLSSIDVPVFHLACVAIALAIMSVVAGFALRPRLHVSLHFPAKTTVGHEVSGHARLTNRSRLSARDLSASFGGLSASLRETSSEELITRLGRSETTDLTMRLRALRRGFYVLPRVLPFTTFPFDLWRTQARCDSHDGTLIVLPDFHPVSAIDVPGSARYQPGGIALTSNVGESPEYIGNRDYRAGDPLRRIDFRSWGRLAKPVVREYQEEYYCRIALVFDTFVPPERKEPPQGFADLEAAVSLSATVADALDREEYILDIFAAGPQLYILRSGRHTAPFESVLEILACVEACRANPFSTVTPALTDELGSISTVICVLLDWDASREGLARAATEAGCNVKIVVVRDGPTTEPLDGAQAWAGSVSQLSPQAIREGRFDVL